MPNQTHCFKLAEMQICNIFFSATLPAAASTYVNGSGGLAGDGFPVPKNGYITQLSVWDDTNNVLYTDVAEDAVSGNNRLSCYATFTGTDFQIRVRKNGVNTSLIVTVPISVMIFVTVTFTQKME